jgi:polar amino acid transport system substrate-binding protein
MKRSSIALLATLAFVLAACGGGEAADDTTSETTVAAETPETTTAPVTETTEAVTETTVAVTETTVAAGGECAVDSLALFEAGKLTIATGEPVFPPWMIDDDPTNGQGFESAVAYALAEQMGFAAEDVQWVRTGFDEAIAPGDKPYDFNMQQYSITAERDEVVDFSLPYYVGQKSLILLEGSPALGATSFADLADATFGATIGTTDLDYIENVLGIADVAVYDTQADVVAAMLAGQIDATVVSLPTALYLTAVEIEGSTIAGVLPGGDGGDGMGLLFTEGSELVPCVNEAMQALTDDGTLEALAVEWLQGAGEIPTITE